MSLRDRRTFFERQTAIEVVEFAEVIDSIGSFDDLDSLDNLERIDGIDPHAVHLLGGVFYGAEFVEAGGVLEGQIGGE